MRNTILGELLLPTVLEGVREDRVRLNILNSLNTAESENQRASPSSEENVLDLKTYGLT